MVIKNKTSIVINVRGHQIQPGETLMLKESLNEPETSNDNTHNIIKKYEEVKARNLLKKYEESMKMLISTGK